MLIVFYISLKSQVVNSNIWVKVINLQIYHCIYSKSTIFSSSNWHISFVISTYIQYPKYVFEIYANIREGGEEKEFKDQFVLFQFVFCKFYQKLY